MDGSGPSYTAFRSTQLVSVTPASQMEATQSSMASVNTQDNKYMSTRESLSNTSNNQGALSLQHLSSNNLLTKRNNRFISNNNYTHKHLLNSLMPLQIPLHLLLNPISKWLRIFIITGSLLKTVYTLMLETKIHSNEKSSTWMRSFISKIKLKCCSPDSYIQ